MGMFDYVDTEGPVECPTCGEPVTGFQSKDGRCELETVPWWDVWTFYASCQKCQTWIRFTRDRPKPVKRLFEGYTMTATTRSAPHE